MESGIECEKWEVQLVEGSRVMRSRVRCGQLGVISGACGGVSSVTSVSYIIYKNVSGKWGG